MHSSTITATGPTSSGRAEWAVIGEDVMMLRSGLRGALPGAMCASAGDFDDRHLGFETGAGRRIKQRRTDIVAGHFANVTADIADQKCHHRAAIVPVRAGEECVATFDAMDEAVFHQEI